jgi:hypothetical protein
MEMNDITGDVVRAALKVHSAPPYAPALRTSTSTMHRHQY